MSDTTLETSPALPEGHRPVRAAGSDRPRPFLARHTWWLVALLVVVVAAVALRVTGTRPGYDPYGWLDWGYQTLRGSLNLGGAPSWKPFTYLFNVPYALLGHYALWLWMLTSVSVSLSGAVFGGRIAYRLTAADPEHRLAAFAAAAFAGTCVLGIQHYFHYVFSAQSDSMLVSVCLAAIDCHISGRRRWAWWLGVLAGLGRPEVWPYLGLYAIWAWRQIPSMRWMLYTGVIGMALLWFGIPTITNHQPNIAGNLALRSPRECTTNKIVCTIDRFTGLHYLPVEIAALLALALAVRRRDRWVLALAGCVVLWVLVEIAFVLHGFPGVPRYLFEPAALTAVLGGIAIGRLLLDASRIHRALPPWAGIPVVAILAAAMIPGAISQIRIERNDVHHERARTQEIGKLAATIGALGGPRHVVSCGRPVVNVEYVSIMAWYTHRNTGTIGYRPLIELHDRRYPLVLFTALRNGWSVTTYRSPRALRSTCAALNSIYVPTAHHPHGVLIRR